MESGGRRLTLWRHLPNNYPGFWISNKLGALRASILLPGGWDGGVRETSTRTWWSVESDACEVLILPAGHNGVAVSEIVEVAQVLQREKIEHPPVLLDVPGPYVVGVGEVVVLSTKNSRPPGRSTRRSSPTVRASTSSSVMLQKTTNMKTTSKKESANGSSPSGIT